MAPPRLASRARRSFLVAVASAAVFGAGSAVALPSEPNVVVAASPTTSQPPDIAAPLATSPPTAPTLPTPTDPATRVLFVGDSVMDQQGNHAAVVLRESGIAAFVEAHWGSTLFTLGQYRDGQPVPQRSIGDESVHWLSQAPRLIDRYDPNLVVVELDHNYWLPLPTDADGRPIADLGGTAAHEMVEAQLRTFVGALRANGADVVWVSPTPSETRAGELWPLMQPVLGTLGVDVVDPNAALRRGADRRAAAASSCDGSPRALWMDDEIHLTRYGAALAATELADMLASRLGVPLADVAAPGETAVALVPWPGGYHVVQCDGSIFRFGAAPIVGSARRAVAGGAPVVDAVASPDGGLYLRRADGSVIAVGTAAPATDPFDGLPGPWPRRVDDPAGGARIVDELGGVVTVDGAPDVGDAREIVPADPFARAWALAHPRPPLTDVVGVAGGYYALTANGDVIARGTATHHGDLAHLARFTD